MKMDCSTEVRIIDCSSFLYLPSVQMKADTGLMHGSHWCFFIYKYFHSFLGEDPTLMVGSFQLDEKDLEETLYERDMTAAVPDEILMEIFSYLPPNQGRQFFT